MTNNENLTLHPNWIELSYLASSDKNSLCSDEEQQSIDQFEGNFGFHHEEVGFYFKWIKQNYFPILIQDL